MEFNCEGKNGGNNGGIMMYNYGLDHREIGEQFLVLTSIKRKITEKVIRPSRTSHRMEIS